MSVLYTLDVTINSSFSYDTILKILERGYALGLTYSNLDEQTLQMHESAHYILNKDKEDLSIYATSEIYGEFFIDAHQTQHGNTQLSIGNFSDLKRKDFYSNKRGLDWKYYIQLALTLCQEFEITKLETNEM